MHTKNRATRSTFVSSTFLSDVGSEDRVSQWRAVRTVEVLSQPPPVARLVVGVRAVPPAVQLIVRARHISNSGRRVFGRDSRVSAAVPGARSVLESDSERNVNAIPLAPMVTGWERVKNLLHRCAYACHTSVRRRSGRKLPPLVVHVDRSNLDSRQVQRAGVRASQCFTRDRPHISRNVRKNGSALPLLWHLSLAVSFFPCARVSVSFATASRIGFVSRWDSRCAHTYIINNAVVLYVYTRERRWRGLIIVKTLLYLVSRSIGKLVESVARHAFPVVLSEQFHFWKPKANRLHKSSPPTVLIRDSVVQHERYKSTYINY